jgi:hypothetical protein
MIAVLPSYAIPDQSFFEQFVSVTVPHTDMYADNTESFSKMIRLIEDFSMNTPVTAVKNKLSELSQLTYNWDGYGASAIPERVIKNSYKFIDTLFSEDCALYLSPEDITPTPYGSIVMDLTSVYGLVSLEIGKTQIGFFTEYEDGENFDSDGEDTDFRSIPDALKKAIDLLYGREIRSAC